MTLWTCELLTLSSSATFWMVLIMSRCCLPCAYEERRAKTSVELGRSEEVGDLDRRVLFAVGAVDGVLADRLRELAADRARRGLGRVGGAHDVAVLGDSVIALEHHD